MSRFFIYSAFPFISTEYIIPYCRNENKCSVFTNLLRFLLYFCLYARSPLPAFSAGRTASHTKPRGRLFAQQLSGEKAGYCIIDRERPDRADRSRTDRDLAMTEHMPDNYYQYYPLSVPGNSSHHLQRMGDFLLCYVKYLA